MATPNLNKIFSVVCVCSTMLKTIPYLLIAGLQWGWKIGQPIKNHIVAFIRQKAVKAIVCFTSLSVCLLLKWLRIVSLLQRILWSQLGLFLALRRTTARWRLTATHAFRPACSVLRLRSFTVRLVLSLGWASFVRKRFDFIVHSRLIAAFPLAWVSRDLQALPNRPGMLTQCWMKGSKNKFHLSRFLRTGWCHVGSKVSQITNTWMQR